MHYGKRHFRKAPKKMGYGDGRKYTDGGMTNPDEPKVVRTIFEEEEFEYEDGGMMSGDDSIRDFYSGVFYRIGYGTKYNKFGDEKAFYIDNFRHDDDLFKEGKSLKDVEEGGFETEKEAREYANNLIDKYWDKYGTEDYADGGMMARGGDLSRLSVGEERVGSKKMYFIYDSENGKRLRSYESKEQAENDLLWLHQVKYAISLPNKKMADGGMIKKIQDGENTWYLTYIDSTHFFLSNSPDFKGNPYHIGQFRGEPFYAEVDEWLKETTREKRNQYADGGMMAKGGRTKTDNFHSEIVFIEEGKENKLIAKFEKFGDAQICADILNEFYEKLYGSKYKFIVIRNVKGKFANGGMMAENSEIKKYINENYPDKDLTDKQFVSLVHSIFSSQIERKRITDSDILKMMKNANKHADGGMMKRGGKLKDKANYIPNRMIQAVEVERRGKTTEIDGADIYDGIYVKKRVKYNSGGKI